MHLSNPPSAQKPLPAYILRRCLLVFLLIFASTPVLAQPSANPSGQPLPRFASTHSKPINVRVGPGKRYDVAWIYVKSSIPVEIVKEFDTWRKIRDISGEEGWVHQSLLSNRRIGRIKANDAEKIALYEKPSSNASVSALLGAAYPLGIEKCDGVWCEVKVKFTTPGGKEKTLSGHIMQMAIWGVYGGEKFD